MLQHGWTLKNYMKWKKPGTNMKGSMLYECIYMKCPQKTELPPTGKRQRLPSAGGMRGDCSGNRFLSGGDENVLKLSMRWIHTRNILKTTEFTAIHFKWLNCAECELHLSKAALRKYRPNLVGNHYSQPAHKEKTQERGNRTFWWDVCTVQTSVKSQSTSDI